MSHSGSDLAHKFKEDTTMNAQAETQETQVRNDGTPHRIPRRVWLAASLAICGGLVTAVVAIVNESSGAAGQMWSVAAPCVSIAGMIAVVCFAIVRYR